MAFPTAVNNQITDIVNETDVDVLQQAPAMAEEAITGLGVEADGEESELGEDPASE